MSQRYLCSQAGILFLERTVMNVSCVLRTIAHVEANQTQMRNFLSFPNKRVAKRFCFSAFGPSILPNSLLYGLNPSSVHEVQTMPASSLAMNAFSMSCDISSLLAKNWEGGSIKWGFLFPCLRKKPVHGFRRHCFHFPSGTSVKSQLLLADGNKQN